MRRGIAELVFRRVAYVPLSRIKPSCSSILYRERFYSAKTYIHHISETEKQLISRFMGVTLSVTSRTRTVHSHFGVRSIPTCGLLGSPTTPTITVLDIFLSFSFSTFSNDK
uniref:Uncharacterized protein n=1 Tax=Brassica oleracea TaxID=3712 RepID=A0A3P6DQ63_BRAOL|nr:unnamed protein product [Brassica oleracea]